MSQTMNGPDGMVVAILMTAGVTKNQIEYRVGLLPQADALEQEANHPSASAAVFSREAALRYFGESKRVVSKRPRPETVGTPVDKLAQSLSVQHAPKGGPSEEIEPLEIILLDHHRVSFPRQHNTFSRRAEAAATSESA